MRAVRQRWQPAQVAKVAVLFGMLVASVPFVIPSSQAATSYSGTVLADNPVGYWRLGEPAGATTTADASGHGATGTVSGGVTFGVAGALADTDTAAAFDGSTGKVSIPDSSAVRLNGSFSIEFWARMTSFANSWPGILVKGASWTANGYLVWYGSDGRLHFKRNNVDAATTSGAIVTGGYRHFVITYDGANVRWYVDGALNSTTARTYPANAGTEPLVLGQGDSGQAGKEAIDEVALYPTALSASQVSAHRAAASSTTTTSSSTTSSSTTSSSTTSSSTTSSSTTTSSTTTSTTAPPPSSSSPITYKDYVYTSQAGGPPTADKPQSKLWFNDGSWWSLMVSNTSKTIRIFELMRDHTWRDTGVTVDNRPSSTGDALWDGTKLYVASRHNTSSPKLMRLSYSKTTRTYSADSGFPVTIAGGGSESITIAKDSTGKLWATYTQNSQVWITHSTTSDNVWRSAYVLPVADTTIDPDDISAVVALNGKIGVMWSNQNSEKMRFVTHTDGAADTTWGPLETALSGTRSADDHINLKTVLTDPSGKLYAVTKTSLGDSASDPKSSALIELLVRDSTGKWTNAVFGTVADDHTRPILLLNAETRTVYVFATAPVWGGTIYVKSTSMDNPSFASGLGKPFVTWNGAAINNATSTKQSVGRATGMVVLASDEDTRTYYHAEMGL